MTTTSPNLRPTAAARTSALAQAAATARTRDSLVASLLSDSRHWGPFTLLAPASVAAEKTLPTMERSLSVTVAVFWAAVALDLQALQYRGHRITASSGAAATSAQPDTVTVSVTCRGEYQKRHGRSQHGRCSHAPETDAVLADPFHPRTSILTDGPALQETSPSETSSGRA